MVLILEGRMFPPGNITMIPLNWKLKLPLKNVRFLMPLEQQAKEGIMVLAGIIDPDYQMEIGLLFQNGGGLSGI